MPWNDIPRSYNDKTDEFIMIVSNKQTRDYEAYYKSGGPLNNMSHNKYDLREKFGEYTVKDNFT